MKRGMAAVIVHVTPQLAFLPGPRRYARKSSVAKRLMVRAASACSAVSVLCLKKNSEGNRYAFDVLKVNRRRDDDQLQRQWLGTANSHGLRRAQSPQGDRVTHPTSVLP